jgi:hypothetical protein
MPFSEVLSDMPPRREPIAPQGPFFEGPPLNRRSFEGDLWDREGHLFQVVECLDRKAARKLLRQPSVQVGVSHCGSGVITWIDSEADREEAWEAELSPNLMDNLDWNPPPGAPGAQPFTPELWREVGGKRLLLLFTDG